ncbi:multi-sensor hybrid histidine kinase [Paludibacter propionicigenes WB4]|uniref:histidine kinase n=2 Tax=Paludibacter TaxID=346096 RepID=E4T6G2_PALPW|nr:multi-sensor hybrid histidine kinase [Paludibacter propionicigenes WB4]
MLVAIFYKKEINMKIKDLKIGTQLVLGFGAMVLFVIILGIVSNIQADKIHVQTEELYNHPLQLGRVVNNIKIDIFNMRLGTRDLMLAVSDEEKQAAIQSIELASADMQTQFNTLSQKYSGPRSDIDLAYKAMINWKTTRDINTKLALAGKLDEVKKNVAPDGIVGKYRTEFMSRIQVIDNYESRMSKTFYANSNKIKDSLNWGLFILIILILIFSGIIIFLLLVNVKVPIKKLTHIVEAFQSGNMSIRSHYDSQNEIGVLSKAFNSMLQSIQTNEELTHKTAELSQIMLLEEDPGRFFATVLPTLAEQTNSQMAAIYLLSEDKKRFEHLSSFGMSDTSKLTFDIASLEGEFGSVLSTRKVKTIKRIPKDTRFLFHTVSGKIVPREIISIPIISGKEVIAIISLASVRTYSTQSALLIENILDTLTARIEGVLSYQRIQNFSKTLEFQNRELEAQKTEMEAQSSELAEQNRELEMQKIQLHEASRLKTNFLSNMSHELRTPLNSVIALSGVLSRRLNEKIPADELSYLEVIERNGKHLLSLINDILDISRIESGREEVDVSKFIVEELVTDIVSIIKPQAQQKNIDLIKATISKDIVITSDIDKCRHILQNLVGNAVKFTEKGSVSIDVVKTQNAIEISVTDTGIGIAESNIDHIFDEFRQADGGTSRKFGGTGLGLAIAKKYANLLGGTVTVKSILGEGSTFTLSLPENYSVENRIVETPRFETSFKNVTPKFPPANNSPKTILLVEDSEPAIIQIKDFLEESGYNILTATGGSEALDIISHTIPDAMILDLMMPEVDGFEVLKTLREAEPTAHIPVLILTAKHITKEDLKFLKKNNIHQLIQKGDVNRNELLSSVAGMLHLEEEKKISRVIPLLPTEGQASVLIVEDNQDNMTTVKAIIGEKFKIFEAVDGIQGVIMAQKHIPDFILMDIALPGVDGIEAFKAIRNDGKLSHIPIIALTASAMTSDRETILAYGFDAYLSKPIDEKVFFKTINKVLYGK